MEDSPVYRELLKELECPVCYTFIAPPVRQCIKMHALCESCFDRLDKCPVCRQKLVRRRNHVLERLYLILDIPCQYRQEGCDTVLKGNAIKDHELECCFRTVTCPLVPGSRCKWSGPKIKTEEHLNEKHRSFVNFASECTVHFAQFKPITKSSIYNTNMYAFGRIFRIAWSINADEGLVSFGVTFLETTEDRSRFSYKIRFVRKKSSRISISLFGRCTYVNDSRCYITHKSKSVVKYDVLKEFCNSDGSLKFSVEIHE